MTEQIKSGHKNDYDKSLESIIRSETQAKQIGDYNALTSKPDIYNYSFSILDSVGGSATQWSIVYDIGRSRMLYKTSGNKRIRTIQFEDIDFSCGSIDMVLDADADPEDKDSFEEFNLYLNEKLINDILSSSDFLRDSLSRYKAGMIAYPKTTKCSETP
jgi:hypothetical protein